MSDFSQYQGPSSEWETFVQKNPLPVGNLSLSPQAIRQATNTLRVRISEAELEADDLRSKTTWSDYCILTRDKQNIIVRVYRPRHAPATALLPVYLYFHGGGHLLGTIETEDAACSRVSSQAGIVVANVGYRHTPEFKHPTQVNDAWDSFEWLASNAATIGADPTRVIVGGISAGAGLAAAVIARQHGGLEASLSRADGLEICGQLLCIPWLVHPDNHPLAGAPTSSFWQNVDAAVLPMALLRLFTDLLGAERDPADPVLNVALIDDAGVVGMPKTSFLVAGQDLLRDEGLFYAEKLKKNGVPTKVHVFPGLPHGFRRFTDLPSSRRWDDLLVESCKWFLSADNTSSFTVMET
ncbi:Alpha/Beta hydrolase protein [Phialemonium atrogriseum]|uniref:Alpha/Beta hydrolase protein n=1 Tax=Phialemonium atrogriseum TaxID=1093897 RepID=A0AAJ0BPD1_9PEZI|nr:Alpha/Beta hydrolase protein [Phialemonium atrogriseum]KAK1761627.1 Alpha/Beta hydrolase protein [Phialemonium atrogriseum]